MDQVIVEQMNQQLLKAWEIYIAFFTVFLTVNCTAIGLVVTKVKAKKARWLIGATFFVQNVIAVVTGIAMATYTRDLTAHLGQMGITPLQHFGDLGRWGGLGNAFGNGIIGIAWLVVAAMQPDSAASSTPSGRGGARHTPSAASSPSPLVQPPADGA